MWSVKSLIFGCAVILVAANEESSREERIVSTPQGPVRGYKDPETNIFEFHGIPYATAPKGQNRYKAPLPPPVWIQTFDAVNDKITCPQSPIEDFMFPEFITQEDCLIANVYVPDTKEKKLSVLVYVHGGAFQLGYGDLITTKQMIKDKNIIAVTFNYRLGLHGFLCLGTENVPGNAGMKDQVALLRWVKRNIASYGGNPDDVTIAGYSAGSAAVDLLLLSPSARGLFNKAIPESGSNVGVWTIQTDPLDTAKSHARSLNFHDVDDVYALEIFYTSSALETLMPSWSMSHVIFNSTFGFVPCVERPTGEEIFLADTPQNILKSGKFTKVPLLYGFANMEGLFRTPLFGTWKDKMNEKFSDFLPADLQFDNEEQKEMVANTIKKFYFGEQPVSIDTMQAYVDYFTDVMFAYGALSSLKLQLATGNNHIYLYVYSFADVGGTPTGYENYTLNGANHCAQSFAIADRFPLDTNNDSPSDDYKKIRDVLREMWTNFVVTGKPVPEGSSLPAWPPMGEDWSPHMELGNTVKLQGSLLQERMLFWEDIYKRYHRSPVPPPTPPTRHSEL